MATETELIMLELEVIDVVQQMLLLKLQQRRTTTELPEAGG